MSKCNYTYVVLSLAFIVVNVITLGNLAPWIDEVMMLDTSYNAAFHGRWETTAWYRVAGQYPFSTYPPLYQMLAAAWMWLFGGTLVAVRSLNLLVTFVLGGVCLLLIKRRGLPLSPCSVALFTVMFWSSSEVSWMYRNGRPDMLCALLVVFTVLAIDHCLRTRFLHGRLAVIATTALLLCSGIEAVAFLCALWLFSFIVRRGRCKEHILLLVLLLTGISLGALSVSLFMMVHGRLVAFVSSIVQYSATLSGIALAVLPWAGDMFSLDTTLYTQKLLLTTTHSDPVQQMLSIAKDRTFLVLSAMTLLAYTTSFRCNMKKLLGDKGFLLLLFSVYTPFVMVLAGRFPAYYRWMAYLPLLASIMLIAARHQLWRAVFAAAAIVMSVFGIRSMLPDKHFDYNNLQSFVQRQHFRSSDVVACPFSVFYEIKPVCDTCYFVGIFPTEYTSHTDYIIEAPDGDVFDKRITDYISELKADTTLVLTAIDHCKYPSLTLYQVKQKHE